MSNKWGLLYAAAIAGAVSPAFGQITGTAFQSGASGQDMGFFFGSGYQATESFGFEGRIGNNGTSGDHEGGLFRTQPGFAYNPGGSAWQHAWHSGSDTSNPATDTAAARVYQFSISYNPAGAGTVTATMFNVANASESYSHTWNWATQAPNPGGQSELNDIVFRLAPNNVGSTGTSVSLTSLALSLGGGPAQNLINPATGNNAITGGASASDSFAPRYFLHFDNVINPTTAFNLTGRASMAWSPELVGGGTGLNGSRLAFEVKFGDFNAIPEPTTWAAGIATSFAVAGVWLRRRRQARG
jgi:hypothetical protein